MIIWATMIDRGFYITDEKIVVVWYSDTLITYPLLELLANDSGEGS